MNYLSILGMIGTVNGLIRAFPQLYRVIKAKEAFGVSVDAAGTSSLVSFGWAVYGYFTNQPFVSLATGSSGIIFGLITLLALKYGRSIKEFKITPIWFVVLLVTFFLSHEAGLGFVLAVSVLASNGPQLWVAYSEGNLIDLSLGTWTLSLIDGFIWGIYSIIGMDFSIMLYAFFQLLTSSFIIFFKNQPEKRREAA